MKTHESPGLCRHVSHVADEQRLLSVQPLPSSAAAGVLVSSRALPTAAEHTIDVMIADLNCRITISVKRFATQATPGFERPGDFKGALRKVRATNGSSRSYFGHRFGVRATDGWPPVTTGVSFAKSAQT